MIRLKNIYTIVDSGSEDTNKDNPRVIIGHDYRSYSEEIKAALKKGLVSTGCYVEDIGWSLYPTVYFAKPVKGTDGNIQFKTLGQTGYVAGGAKAWIDVVNQKLQKK